MHEWAVHHIRCLDQSISWAMEHSICSALSNIGYGNHIIHNIGSRNHRHRLRHTQYGWGLQLGLKSGSSRVRHRQGTCVQQNLRYALHVKCAAL